MTRLSAKEEADMRFTLITEQSLARELAAYLT
jgi:hypothetical protein